MATVSMATSGWCADSSNTNTTDPLLDLFIKKGFVTQQEAEQVETEAAALRTNEAQMPSAPPSKWKISQGIKNVELFGDISCVTRTVRRKTRRATALICSDFVTR